MISKQSDHSTLSVGVGQPLIGVITQENGREVVHYFFEDITPTQQAIQYAQSLAGAWSDLNWDDLMATLERIRHETPPSPPFSL